MNRAARNLRPRFEGLALSVETGKRGKKGRVDIDNSIGKRLKQNATDEPHVSGQDDEINARATQGRQNGAFVILFGLEIPGRMVERRNAVATGVLDGEMLSLRERDIAQATSAGVTGVLRAMSR